MAEVVLPDWCPLAGKFYPPEKRAPRWCPSTACPFYGRCIANEGRPTE